MLKRVAQNGLALRHATEELRGDREVVMTAVAEDWQALEYATEELRGDREVVMTAVTSNGWGLLYATEELRGDREVVMTAIAQNGWAVNHASEELRGDREVMEAALAVVGVQAVGLKVPLDPACLLSWKCLEEKKNSATSGALCVQSAILDNPHGLWTLLACFSQRLNCLEAF